jgi:hypothetical protein
MPNAVTEPEFQALMVSLRDYVKRDPAALVQAVRELSDALLRGSAYPAMIVRVSPDPDSPDEREDDVTELVCPHCGSTEGVYIVDVAERWTLAEPDHDDQTYTADYDGGGDFAELYQRCAACGVPVTMPEGWEESN